MGVDVTPRPPSVCGVVPSLVPCGIQGWLVLQGRREMGGVGEDVLWKGGRQGGSYQADARVNCSLPCLSRLPLA